MIWLITVSSELERHHRQNRSGIFLPASRHPQMSLIHDRRCNLKECAITLAACDNLRRIDQSNQTSEMLLIDNAAVIGIRPTDRLKLLPDLLLHFVNKCILNRSRFAVHIIRCHTGLTAIQIFAKDNASGRQLYIGCLVNDTRAFPPSSNVTGVRCFAACAITSYLLPDCPQKRYNQTFPLTATDSLYVRRSQLQRIFEADIPI